MLNASVSNVTGANSEAGHGDTASRHNSAKEVQPLSEHQKSASFISSNTMEDNDKLLQSAVSMEGQTVHVDEDGNEVDEGMEEELDKATRQFNFWTHQIHIFFVRKFLPAAEHMIKLKQAVEKKLSAEFKQMKTQSSTALVEPSQVIVEEKTQT